MKVPGRRSGMTLPEVMVAAVIFLLFSTSLISVLSLGMDYLQIGQQKILAQGNARMVADCIISELKQAIPNPNATTGYPGITPAIVPSAVLYPNSNNRSADYIIFTEPNPLNYAPYTSGWSYENASNYQTVRYYVSSGTVYREMKRFDSAGNQVSVASDPVARTSEGTISLSFSYLSGRLFSVSVTSSEKDGHLRTSSYSITGMAATLGI
jgi:prepilin-type N-terminal cleavage/methylation domain-containing protein